jgi:6-phospho-3-hexuloisomerase
MTDLGDLAARALGEISACLYKTDEAELEALIGHLARPRRIAIYGCGREGLMMRALCMRLFHLGLDVHMVGDMTTPPLGDGDLLLVSCGPGHLSTVDALAKTAKAAGAEIAVITAEPDGAITRLSDAVLTIPAQTMARDEDAPTSFLPMGSLFEGAQFMLFEILVIRLRDRLGETPETMRARHTNLE